MKLKTVQLHNFRSVEDSEVFDVDQTTCLVGKNEAGKTAVLFAIATLNPHPATPCTLDRERDYPRRFLTSYGSRHPNGEAEVVVAQWELEDSDIKAVEAALGARCLVSNAITVRRRYGAGPLEWDIKLNAANVIEAAAEKVELPAEDLGAYLPLSIVDAHAALQGEENLSEPKQRFRDRLAELGDIDKRAVALLAPRLPKFMYFSTYDRMEGAVQIEHLDQLIQNKEIDKDNFRGHKLFADFFKYAGVPLAEIRNVGTYETFNALLQAASNGITDQILAYWTQNPYLEVRVGVEAGRPQDPPPFNGGTVARARVNNTLHRAETPFSERSAGFVWFFSFLVKFSQVKDDQIPVILLLDEPGLTLHGKAQTDLLRYFDEKLAPNHQTIFSTHSPFMVPPGNLSSVRIVEDQVKTIPGRRPEPFGTKVRANVLSLDPGTRFPLQGALGYEITQTLFIGRHSLLVEGTSDIVYLHALSDELTRRKRIALDARWTLCPSGGVGNVRAFMTLFGGNAIDAAVLADYAAGQKNQIEALKKSDVLKPGRVFTLDTYTGKAEADVEDLFDPELFVQILNGTYALGGPAAVTVARLSAADPATIRLVKQAEAFFRTNLPPSGAEFSHFAPAEWLATNSAILASDDPAVLATLERAESLFTDLNKLLA